MNHADSRSVPGSGPSEALALWQAEYRNRRRQSWMVAASLLACLALAAIASEFNPLALPGALAAMARYFTQLGPDLSTGALAPSLQQWFWAGPRWLGLLLDTLAIAFLSTLWALVVAVALALLASPAISRLKLLRAGVLRLLELARTVPEMVFALVFVVAFGLGPLAGILALGLHSLGALGRLFVAVNENAESGPLESVAAVGANSLQVARYALLPHVLPAYVSYTLLRLETNVRSASVIGLVGVGGIGQELYFAIRQFLFADVGAMLLLLIATVMLLDAVGDYLRGRLGVTELHT